MRLTGVQRIASVAILLTTKRVVIGISAAALGVVACSGVALHNEDVVQTAHTNAVVQRALYFLITA